jgi:hypothetical protein
LVTPMVRSEVGLRHAAVLEDHSQPFADRGTRVSGCHPDHFHVDVFASRRLALSV